MQNYSDIPDNDIAKEPYKGPSAVSAAAGEGYIAHIQWAVLGLGIGGTLSAIVPKTINMISEQFERFHVNQRENSNLVVRAFALGTGAIRSGVDFIAGHIPGKEWLKTKIHPERYKAVIFGGSLTAAFGFFILPILLAPFGWKRGNDGKQQFERAKDEIWDLRAENDKLREKNVDLKTRLTDAETTKAADENRLRVTKDDPPVIRDDNEGIALQAAEHPETPTTIESPPVKEPEIKEPKIGPANTTGRTLDRSDRDWSELMQAQKAEQQAKEATIH